MKHRNEMSDRELLIRIDERTSDLPALSKTVCRHDRELLIAKVLFVMMILAIAKSYPWVADVFAKMIGS